MLIGCIGMTISLSGVATIFITGHWHAALIFFVAGFTASFAISSGSVIWVYMTARYFPLMFESKDRPSAAPRSG